MKVYLKDARASFVKQLFTADQINGQGKPKFTVAAIIDKRTKAYAGEVNPDSPRGIEQGLQWVDPKVAFSTAIMAAGTEKWKGDALDVIKSLKATNRLPLHDGEEKAQLSGYAGNMFMNAGNEIRPQVRDGRTGAQLQASDGVIYSGCRIDVVADIWAQDNQWGKRVNASLLAVTFTGDDERLSGGAQASSDDYAAIPEKAAATAATSGQGAGSLFG